MKLRSMVDVANGFATIVADSSAPKRLATNTSARGTPPFPGGHNQLPLIHNGWTGILIHEGLSHTVEVMESFIFFSSSQELLIHFVDERIRAHRYCIAHISFGCRYTGYLTKIIQICTTTRLIPNHRVFVSFISDHVSTYIKP